MLNLSPSRTVADACPYPYMVKDMEYYENYYNEIIYPVEKVNFKSAITARNKWMVENSDVLLAYAERDEGGAADCLKYAQKLGLKIINYADKRIETPHW